MGARTLFSIEDFLSLPEPEDGVRFELDEGELITVSPASGAHARRLDRIYRYLIQHLSEAQYDILPGEVGFILGDNPKPIVRGADLAVVAHREKYDKHLLREPALLIVKVLSPSNTVEDVERKRVQYLRHGVRELWIVYEDSQTIHAWQQSEQAGNKLGYELTAVEEGTGFVSLLGFPVHLSKIFS